jgi:hypothetical protein
MPAMAQTQTTSAFLAVQKITADPATSKMRVVVKNVGQQKVTGCGLLASSQQYTQEFVYSVGMEPKLTLSRPPGFGGIQPGESVELLFPLNQGGALTAEVNAVILEDRTAVGDENEIASMFRQRLAYASEWERWALVMREDPSHYRSPAEREGERAEMLRVLPQDPNEQGDAATVAGRMAARRALASLLAQTTAANWASLLGYVEERAASLQRHAQRAGWIANYAEPTAVANGRHANVKPSTSEVRMDGFSCHYPGQSLGVAGYADILRGGGIRQGSSTSKAGTLSVAATGACGVSGPPGAISVPTCTPAFFTTASSSASSATITGLSYSYIPTLGCTIAGSQAATTLVSKTNMVAEDSESCADTQVTISCDTTDLSLGSTAPKSTVTGSCTTTAQPTGGSFSWSTNKNTITLTPTQDGSGTSYTSANASSALGDTTIQVTYTVNGQPATAKSGAITVHKPTSLYVAQDVTPIASIPCTLPCLTNPVSGCNVQAGTSCTYSENQFQRDYHVYDQFTTYFQDYGINDATVTESINLTSNNCAGKGVTTGTGSVTDITDTYGKCDSCCENGGPGCTSVAAQTISVNGYNIFSATITTTCTTATVKNN